MQNFDGVRVMWVCQDCHLDHHYPGEGDLSDHERERLWSQESALHWDHGFPFGMGECPHDFERDWNTPDGDKHSGECEVRDFDTRPCPACGTHLAGDRYAYQQEVSDVLSTYWVDLIEYRARSADTLARRLHGQTATTTHRRDDTHLPVHCEWWEVYVGGEWVSDIFPA